jgi:two-component system sensor histidine kinase PilS (NtrC family)
MEDQIKRMDRLAAIGGLAAGIAHEIRNPLTSLSGSIQVLRDELDLHNENRKLMDIAVSETKRLNNLLTDFLLFAQPERGEEKKLNLSSLLKETLELFVHSPECKQNIRVTQSIVPDIFIKGNAGHLKQVFWNILKNAVQSQPGGGIIHIRAMPDQQKVAPGKDILYQKAKISIKDTGSGIPKEIQKKIFDPFFTTKEQGSGLGLAISHRIIENHTGELDIRSEENQGTEVVIVLPLVSDNR